MTSRLPILLLLIVIAGCGESSPPSSTPSAPASQASASPTASAGIDQTEPTMTGESASPIMLPSISLGGTETAPTLAGQSSVEDRGEEQHRELLDAMQPLQVMLGTWKGTTQKEFGDFKALDEPVWIWDFQTDPGQPAMVMTSAASPYFRSLRLTYLTDADRFRLITTGADGTSRTLEGTFTQPVEEFQGDDKRLHRRYKLELTEVDSAEQKSAWQVVFNQQENNRYLVELSRKRSSRFMRFDTIATQRQGTSIALSDEGYGEKTCIITGGLGTSTVSHNGKTYWVCCSGCRKAFEDDPEKWIAAAANLK